LSCIASAPSENTDLVLVVIWYNGLQAHTDDNYIDDSNDDLTDLMQDDLELEVMEQEFG